MRLARKYLVIVSILLVAVRANADEVRVMTSGAFTEALRQLSAEYERERTRFFPLGRGIENIF